MKFLEDDEDTEKPPVDPNLPIPMDTWPLLLPMQIAEHETSIDIPLHTMEEIADHFDITVDDIERYKQQKSFRAEVRGAILEVKDTGSVVRQKARAQFEHYLDTLIPMWFADDRFPANEKVKLFQYLGKTARITDDPAEKVKAEVKALPTEKTTTLNLYLQAPSGETQKMTGVTINQTPEALPNGEEEKT